MRELVVVQVSTSSDMLPVFPVTFQPIVIFIPDFIAVFCNRHALKMVESI